jgi:phosphatidylglycerol---prolipoprotein diacylglyceryl transferase
MYPVLFTIHPISLPVHSYGVMLGISLVAGWFLTMRSGKSQLPPSQLKKMIFLSAICALLGARILAILTTWRHLDWQHPLTLLVPGHTGLVAYGGFIGGFLGALAFHKRLNVSLSVFADAAAPSLALGLGITRIGCFLYGCDYGRPIPETAPVWLQKIGIRFPNWEVAFHNAPGFSHHPALQKGAPAFWHHVHMGIIPGDAALSFPVYPAQIIASLNGFILFALLLHLRKRCTFSGQLFLILVMYYGITRTLIEFIRGDSGRGILLSLTTSQWIGIITCLVAMMFYLRMKRNALRG